MEDKILAMLKEVCDGDDFLDDYDLDLFEEGLIDSLGFVELLVKIEQELNIIIDPVEVNREDIETTRKLIDYITKLS